MPLPCVLTENVVRPLLFKGNETAELPAVATQSCCWGN